MRNFRTAAVAAATATTVAISGTAVASATLSSEIGAKTEADKTVTGEDLLGSSVKDETNPEWAKIWRDTTYVGMATASIAVVVAAYNFAVYNGMIPDVVGKALAQAGF